MLDDFHSWRQDHHLYRGIQHKKGPRTEDDTGLSHNVPSLWDFCRLVEKSWIKSARHVLRKNDFPNRADLIFLDDSVLQIPKSCSWLSWGENFIHDVLPVYLLVIMVWDEWLGYTSFFIEVIGFLVPKQRISSWRVYQAEFATSILHDFWEMLAPLMRSRISIMD